MPEDKEVKCPHCGKVLDAAFIMSEAASIRGRRNPGNLSSKRAKQMARKRWGNKKKKA